MVPVVEHGAGQLRTRVEVVLTNEFVQFFARHAIFHQIDLHHVHITEVVEVVVLVPDIGHTTAHTGGEVSSCLTKHNHPTACHVLAAVVACAFQYRNGTGVPDTEAFTYLAIDIELTAGGTVKTRITCDDIVLSSEIGTCRRKNGNTSARETLGEVVVGFAFELEADAMFQEGTERLSCGTFELHVDGIIVQPSQSVLLGDDAREHGTHGAIGILDGIVEVHLFTLVDSL